MSRDWYERRGVDEVMVYGQGRRPVLLKLVPMGHGVEPGEGGRKVVVNLYCGNQRRWVATIVHVDPARPIRPRRYAIRSHSLREVVEFLYLDGELRPGGVQALSEAGILLSAAFAEEVEWRPSGRHRGVQFGQLDPRRFRRTGEFMSLRATARVCRV